MADEIGGDRSVFRIWGQIRGGYCSFARDRHRLSALCWGMSMEPRGRDQAFAQSLLPERGFRVEGCFGFRTGSPGP